MHRVYAIRPEKDPIKDEEAKGHLEDGTRFRDQSVPFAILMFATASETEIGCRAMSVRILVVDDSAAVRDGLRRLLEDHRDWEVCGEAGNGIEGIEKYRQLHPDLVIVDVSMPLMNGLDASLEILKLSPAIPILLYTSYLTNQLIEVAHKAGIRGTVSKDAMHLVVTGAEALLRGGEFSSPSN